MEEQEDYIEHEPLFSFETLTAMVPRMRKPNDWFLVLNGVLPVYGITNKRRVAAWVAQCGHESQDFNTLVENLNYSAEGLVRTWPRHFPNLQFAQQYHRRPEAIANRAYRNRMGNGSEESGDGWKYRGRGLIMITGKNNYGRCSRELFDSDVLLEHPELLEQPMYATHSACWYWDTNNLNDLADRREITNMSRVINGGTIGLKDRIERYNHCMKVLDESTNLPD